MKLTSRRIRWNVALSALAISAIGAGCSSTHSHHYYTTTPTSSGSAGYTQSTTTQTSYSSSTSPDTQGQAQSQQQAASTTESGDTVVPLYQESIKVGTREVDGGAVRLRKIVTTETVNQPVQIRREKLVIEREPGGAQTSANMPQGSLNGAPFQQQETVIRLKREEPVIETQVVPAGRVVAQKRSDTQQQNVQRQIRKEDVQVEKIGNPENVIISQGVRQGQGSEAAGSSPAPEGQVSGSNTSK